MIFVVDAPLPPVLADWICAKGHEAFAIRDVGLRNSPDQAIWSWASRQGCVIVTKDRDFANLVLASDGPAVLWVRIGNTTNPTLFDRFEREWPEVVALLESGNRIIELR
ncbi:MAG TPA: DUF5615 family PIN-like protein [Rhizomicrobium sp.]|jgi:predicted nuclease of predicted toxin-antitoxin system|nr:DUF5615 family PIN-like protein [Rhizomicrobium sp.]